MAEIDAHTEILEDYEILLELKAAFEAGHRQAFDGVLHELADELANDYRTTIEEKVCRWQQQL